MDSLSPQLILIHQYIRWPSYFILVVRTFDGLANDTASLTCFSGDISPTRELVDYPHRMPNSQEWIARKLRFQMQHTLWKSWNKQI